MELHTFTAVVVLEKSTDQHSSYAGGLVRLTALIKFGLLSFQSLQENVEVMSWNRFR
jgi:hypothetical protein